MKGKSLSRVRLLATPWTAVYQAPRPWDFPGKILEWGAIAFSDGSDHELLNAKFRLKLKKVGENIRPFRYDLNQIPSDNTVGVRNRFKGLDLIDRVPDELWTEVRDIVQETRSKTIPMEKKCKKAKWLSGEALQIAVKRRKAKAKEKRKDISISMQSSKQ